MHKWYEKTLLTVPTNNMENDFNAKIDENWYEQTTRLVFADWLDEQNDPRAIGYRAIAHIDFVPYPNDTAQPLHCSVADYTIGTQPDHPKDQSNLPLDWYEMTLTLLPEDDRPTQGQRWFQMYDRKTAEELVVKAFLMLSKEKQDYIFTMPLIVLTKGICR